jgi:transcriptional regulator with XRE-family HTH domain
VKEMDPRVAFGEGVRRLREARKLTQAALAERSDLQSWKYIGTVENARTNITLTNVVKLAAGLGISVAELMETCFPQDEKRKELLTDLLKLIANEDDKTVRLVMRILNEVKRSSTSD